MEWTLELKNSPKKKRNFGESHQQKRMKGTSFNSLISTSSWVTSVTSYFVSPPFPTLPKALPWTIFETTLATKGISPLFNSISPFFFFSRIREIRLVTWWSILGSYIVIWNLKGHGWSRCHVPKYHQVATSYHIPSISQRKSVTTSAFQNQRGQTFLNQPRWCPRFAGFFIPKFSEKKKLLENISNNKQLPRAPFGRNWTEHFRVKPRTRILCIFLAIHVPSCVEHFRWVVMPLMAV